MISIAPAVAYGGIILEEGQQSIFHPFKEEDLSLTVIKFRDLVLNEEKTKKLLKFRIRKVKDSEVVLQGLLNRHTYLAPKDDHPINDLPMRITILQDMHPMSEEAFQKWLVCTYLLITYFNFI